MRYAILNEEGLVINVAVASQSLYDNWIEGETANIGDTWDGEKFIKPDSVIEDREEIHED